jgi:hypothetical protein
MFCAARDFNRVYRHLSYSEVDVRLSTRRGMPASLCRPGAGFEFSFLSNNATTRTETFEDFIIWIFGFRAKNGTTKLPLSALL